MKFTKAKKQGPNVFRRTVPLSKEQQASDFDMLNEDSRMDDSIDYPQIDEEVVDKLQETPPKKKNITPALKKNLLSNQKPV